MGFDRWMDIQGSLPSTQRPLAQTWACGCPPSELSMPLTSHRGVGPCRLWTRSPPFIADDAWHCTSLQSPRRSYVSGHRDHWRPAETSYYACLWGSQGGDGKISCLDCSWRVDSDGSCCYAWHCRKTANVGQCGSPPSCRNYHWLMLSCWQQWDAAGVPGSALSQWLVGIDVDSGPDGRNSPTYLKQNFDAQEAADLYQAVHLHTLEDLGENGPYPKLISQLALRIITYEYPLEAILAIYYLSATGYLPAKFPHDQWNEAVRWHGDTKLAATIQNEAEWADAKIMVEAESQHGVVVWSSTQNCPSTIPADSYPLQLIVVPGQEIQRRLPETLHVEATGLGGRDLLNPIPWDISIKSDKEGQSIYGPSLAPMEETVDVPGIFGGTETVQVTALGRSKAAHEFLVLHYFGLDSAKHSCLTSCRRFSSPVPQPVGLLLWKCLEPHTLHRPTAECPTYCGPTQWIWFGTFWWVVEWDDTRVPQTHWYLTSALTSEAFLLAALLVLAPSIYYGKSQM